MCVCVCMCGCVSVQARMGTGLGRRNGSSWQLLIRASFALMSSIVEVQGSLALHSLLWQPPPPAASPASSPPPCRALRLPCCCGQTVPVLPEMKSGRSRGQAQDEVSDAESAPFPPQSAEHTPTQAPYKQEGQYAHPKNMLQLTHTQVYTRMHAYART